MADFPASAATYIGRWFGTTTKTVLTQGNRCRLQFTGTALTVAFTVPVRSYATEIEYSIDGGAYTRANVAESMELATGLADATHTCDIWTCACYWGDVRWDNAYGWTITGFTVDAGKTVSTWPTGNTKHLLVLGDSIGEGELMLGYSAVAPTNRPQYSDARLCFASLVGASIGADVTNFCFGGSSMVIESDDVPPAASIYPYAALNVAKTDSGYDVVILEGGNNDNGADPEDFAGAYQDLIDLVLADSPNATVVCLGMFIGDKSSVIKGLAETNGLLYLDANNDTYSRPLYVNHPSTAGHAGIAAGIVETLTRAWAETEPTVGLSRTVSGLLVRDEFSADTLANYTNEGTAAPSWAISGGLLSQSTAGIWTGKRHNASVSCKCATSRMKGNGGAMMGVQCAEGAVADGDGLYPCYQMVIHNTLGHLLRERAGGAHADLATNATLATMTNYRLMRCYTDGTTVCGKAGATTLGDIALSANDATRNSGSGGVFTRAQIDYDWLELRTAHTVVVSGLPTGYYVKVTDGATTAKVAESSGTATVDAGAVLFPLARVSVYDGDPDAGGTEKAFIASATLADMGGGDEYVYAPARGGLCLLGVG